MTYPDLNAGTESFERAYVRAGSEPAWARITHDGVDVTDTPEAWTSEDAQRRCDWLERKARYQETPEAPHAV